jgi:hypothetical protein
MTQKPRTFYNNVRGIFVRPVLTDVLRSRFWTRSVLRQSGIYARGISYVPQTVSFDLSGIVWMEYKHWGERDGSNQFFSWRQ